MSQDACQACRLLTAGLGHGGATWETEGPKAFPSLLQMRKLRHEEGMCEPENW